METTSMTSRLYTSKVESIYRFTVSCIDQRDGLCLHLYTAAYLEF